MWVTAFSPHDSDSVSRAMSVTAVIIITVFVHHSAVLSAHAVTTTHSTLVFRPRSG